MEQLTVWSWTSHFHVFVTVFMANTAQEVTKMSAVDAHEQKLLQALIRRRALCAASDQGLQYLFLHKAGFCR